MNFINVPVRNSDYRGPVGVILVKLGDAPFEVTHGMRIAQIVPAPAARAQFSVTDTLGSTARGPAGFGSTGIAGPGDRVPRR